MTFLSLAPGRRDPAQVDLPLSPGYVGSTMRTYILRWLVTVLVAFSLVTGTTAIAMPSGMVQQAMAKASVADTPCASMSEMQSAEGRVSSGSMPCKSITPDCMKQMTCFQALSIPGRSASGYMLFVYGSVTYWTKAQPAAGVSRKPDLFPPIAD